MGAEQPMMRIFCKANETLNAAVHGGKVILVPANASDETQHWIQDYDKVGNLTDEQGRRAFALVNRATGQALQVNKTWNVELAEYRGHERVELSMLWSLGVKLHSGFSEVRVLRYLARTLNAVGGSPINEGKVVGTFNSEPHYDHAIWKIVPINKG